VQISEQQSEEIEQTIRQLAQADGWIVFKVEVSIDCTVTLSVDRGTPETRRATYVPFHTVEQALREAGAFLANASRPAERRPLSRVG